MNKRIRELAEQAGFTMISDVCYDKVSVASLNEFAELIRADEREACARVAEEWLGPTKDRELHIAAAIRARGERNERTN